MVKKEQIAFAIGKCYQNGFIFQKSGKGFLIYKGSAFIKRVGMQGILPFWLQLVETKGYSI